MKNNHSSLYEVIIPNLKINNMRAKIRQIIDSINGESEELNMGLLGGKSGLALFYYYCSLFEGEKNSDKSINNIEDGIIEINDGNFFSTYSSGIAGFGWVVAFLNRQKMFSDSDIEFLDNLDNYLYQNMISDFKIKKYDYLHGALGYGVYFLKRLQKQECREFLKELVNQLENIAIKETDGALKWGSLKHGTDDEIIYNLSLSHGIASIINILTRIYKAEIEQEKCVYLINGAMKYLFKQEIDKNKHNSFFPSWALESTEELSGSRMAWCYGDLGIAITLWQAGNALNVKEWSDKSIEIMRFSATRRDIKTNYVSDAGLCHGAAGIGHVFYRMWWNTRLPEFKEAAGYWFDETLKMAYHKDGLAGFKVWDGAERIWQKEVGFLEGVAGIGLALMTYHYQVEPTWDECLLLS